MVKTASSASKKKSVKSGTGTVKKRDITEGAEWGNLSYYANTWKDGNKTPAEMIVKYRKMKAAYKTENS